MSQITVYTTEPCGYCRVAKALLAKRGVTYEEINLAKDPEGRAELVRRTGMMTFPQVVIDGETIGGYQAPVAYDKSGSLAELAAAPSARPATRSGGPVSARGQARPPRRAGTRLAALAHVCPAAGHAQLAHRPAAARARLALAQVHEELVLEAAADPVRVAEVVDRGALGLQPGQQRRDDRIPD